MAKSNPGGFKSGFHGPGSKPAPQPADKTFTPGYNRSAGEPKSPLGNVKVVAPKKGV